MDEDEFDGDLSTPFSQILQHVDVFGILLLIDGTF